jgi:hypothetical protein
MAFPKQCSRRIVVGEETYLWYLKRNDAWKDSKHIAIRQEAAPTGQLLLLDMYAWAFEIRPRTIRDAIEFALRNGWTPQEKAQPLYIGFDNLQFVRLPPGDQYLSHDTYPIPHTFPASEPDTSCRER